MKLKIAEEKNVKKVAEIKAHDLLRICKKVAGDTVFVVRIQGADVPLSIIGVERIFQEKKMLIGLVVES